jgi:hypothetical protein
LEQRGNDKGMNRVTVVDVLDGNTLAVWPPWTLTGRRGSLIRVRGLCPPASSSTRNEEARCKLMFLLLGGDIHVSRVYGISEDALICDVFYSGRNLIAHLPEFASHVKASLSVERGAALPALPDPEVVATSLESQP